MMPHFRGPVQTGGQRPDCERDQIGPVHRVSRKDVQLSVERIRDLYERTAESDFSDVGNQDTAGVLDPLAADAAAIDALAAEGISCDLIDPRTSSPLDTETILESVEATGHLVVVDESPPRCGLTADIAALAADKAFHALKGPVKQVCAPHSPTPFSPELEAAYLPDAGKIIAAIKATLA